MGMELSTGVIRPETISSSELLTLCFWKRKIIDIKNLMQFF